MIVFKWILGLSPLARGTQDSKIRRATPRRFIPAGAGNTPIRPGCTFPVSVYPRWRGEHLNDLMSGRTNIGLSPLARGTLSSVYTAPYMKRFIPAGAGNTCGNTAVSDVAAVYPRWRGEHRKTWRAIQAACGLSPLARGTRSYTIQKNGGSRFIPAGAGNTLKLYICSKSPFLLPNKLPTVR